MAPRILATVAILTALTALLVVSVLAVFTDSDDVDTNDFATGSLSLTTSPTSTIWAAVSDAVPGSKATGSLTVTNAGSLDLRYAVSGANTDATLSAAMNLRIGLQAGGSCDFPYHNDDGTTTSLSDDTELYAGALDTAALIGDATQGADSGDRALASSANEVLCFAVVLPDTAGGSVSGLSNSSTFTFDSEQTLNNP